MWAVAPPIQRRNTSGIECVSSSYPLHCRGLEKVTFHVKCSSCWFLARLQVLEPSLLLQVRSKLRADRTRFGLEAGLNPGFIFIKTPTSIRWTTRSRFFTISNMLLIFLFIINIIFAFDQTVLHIIGKIIYFLTEPIGPMRSFLSTDAVERCWRATWWFDLGLFIICQVSEIDRSRFHRLITLSNKIIK